MEKKIIDLRYYEVANRPDHRISCHTMQREVLMNSGGGALSGQPCIHVRAVVFFLRALKWNMS